MQNPSRHIRRCYRSIERWARARFRALNLGVRPTSHQRYGRWGERVAAIYVGRRGTTILQTNWKASALEADIVALERRTLLIIEVKTRHHSLRRRYPAIGAITTQKQRHLETLARAYLRNHGPLCRRTGIRHHRVDAIEVYYTRSVWGRPRVTEIRWHRGLSSSFMNTV